MARTKHGLPGIYNSSPITLTNEEGSALGVNSSGQTLVDMATKLDRTNDSITNYPVGCNMTVVDTSDNTTTVTASPAILLGVYVNTVLSAHTVVIKDDTTAKITLPAGLAAGSNLSFPNASFATSLVVDPDDSSTGNITVFWRAA